MRNPIQAGEDKSSAPRTTNSGEQEVAEESASCHRPATDSPRLAPSHEPISETIAAKHDKALAELSAILVQRGLRVFVVEWLKVTMSSSSYPPNPLSAVARYAPELVVFGAHGCRAATVHMGARSCAYVMDVAQTGDENACPPDRRYIVPFGQADKAAEQIPGYLQELP
jgi:hypothetical protein